MLEAAAIFLHHADDELTRRHLAILHRSNPASDVAIVPIHASGNRHVEGSIDAGCFDCDQWRHEDLIFAAYLARPDRIQAKRYFLMEYDARATMPLAEFYADVWDADAVANRIIEPPAANEVGWYWFHETGFLPIDWQPRACGIGAICGVMLSSRAARAVAELLGEHPLPGVVCDLRFPTALRVCGFQWTAMPPDRAATIQGHPERITVSDLPGIYHPVKTLIPLHA